MAQFLFATLIAAFAISYCLACDGNYVPLCDCMKENLPNATKLAEDIKTCYDSSGCATSVAGPNDNKGSKLNQLLTSIIKIVSALFDLEKLAKCQSTIAPLVRTPIEKCVKEMIPDFKFPKFDIGFSNSSFFGGDVNATNFTCNSNDARKAFSQCLADNHIGNPWEQVCNAEEICKNKTIAENHCTTDDAKEVVKTCADRELPLIKNPLTEAARQCLGISNTSIFKTDMVSFLLPLIKKMGNGCELWRQAQLRQIQQPESVANQLQSWQSSIQAAQPAQSNQLQSWQSSMQAAQPAQPGIKKVESALTSLLDKFRAKMSG